MKRGVKQSNKYKTESRAASGSIRIISGRFRSRKLPVLDVSGLRPTTDKNKEMLFNWLMAHIREARCLDVFAGSGGLGFEALSRYAQHCTFIELEKKAANQIKKNAALLALSGQQVTVLHGNALQVLQSINQSFELIFLDPPFNQNLLPEVIELIVQQDLLAKNGLIYIECEGSGGEYQVPAQWQLVKEKSSAQILARLYQREA